MTNILQKPKPPIPSHWIGVRKYWRLLRMPLREALVEINADHLSNHGLIVGSSGSGKSVLCAHLATGALLRGQSLLILDARRDSAISSLELAARIGIPPKRVQFLDVRADRPIGFDALGGSGPPYAKALGFVGAIEAQNESWGVQLSESLRYAALLLAEGGGRLPQMEGLFYDRALRLTLISRASSPAVKAFWSRYDAMHPERQASLAAPVLNKLSVLTSTQGLRLMFEHPSPLNLAHQLNTPGSLTVVALGVDQTHGAGWAVGKLFLNAVSRELFARVDIPESRRNPVLLMVDEAEHFFGPTIEALLVESRKFGGSVLLAHQNMVQQDARMRSLVLGNVGFKCYFRSSYGDSDLLNRDISGVKGTFDIANLRTGEAVLWRIGETPFEIEVNAPLIDDVGAISPLARSYLAELAKHAESKPEANETAVSEVEPKPSADSPPHHSGKPNLDDWLSQ